MGMLSIEHRIADDTRRKPAQRRPCFVIDQPRDPLYSSAAAAPADVPSRVLTTVDRVLLGVLLPPPAEPGEPE